MKAVFFAPLLLLASVSVSTIAADKEVIVIEKEKASREVLVKDQFGETMRVKLIKRDGKLVALHEGHEHELSGNALKDFDFEEGGDYRIWGNLSDDGKSFETTRIRPVIVEHEVKFDQPVVRERVRVKDDPIIKLGPFEIND